MAGAHPFEGAFCFSRGLYSFPPRRTVVTLRLSSENESLGAGALLGCARTPSTLPTMGALMARTGGGKATRFREAMKVLWQPVNAACALCGQADIDWDGPAGEPDSFELDHRLSVLNYPELEFDPGNAQPSHCRCNRSKQAGRQKADIGLTSEPW